MDIKESIIITLTTGELVIILLVENVKQVKSLHEYLKIDAYQFKKSVEENISDVEYISAGYRDDKGEIYWESDLIPVPKWYERN